MVQQPAQLAISQIEGTGLKIGILVPRYKPQIINTLISNTYEVLLQNGVVAEDIHIMCVPAFYELAGIVTHMLARDTYDAIICFGSASRATLGYSLQDSLPQGFQWVALYNGVPVIFGMPGNEPGDYEQSLARIEHATRCAYSAIRMARAVRTGKAS
ncbi:MAG TPA: 6,7-dimethyl-8-ribityllumazine synthase [Ktedonobacteraceae bacterium]